MISSESRRQGKQLGRPIVMPNEGDTTTLCECTCRWPALCCHSEGIFREQNMTRKTRSEEPTINRQWIARVVIYYQMRRHLIKKQIDTSRQRLNHSVTTTVERTTRRLCSGKTICLERFELSVAVLCSTQFWAEDYSRFSLHWLCLFVIEEDACVI